MINIYYKKDLELGYDFYYFRGQEYGRSFEKYEYESQLENGLADAKLELMKTNIEDFVLRFKEYDIMKNELQNTSLQRMQDFIRWAGETNAPPEKIYSALNQMESFIITIVNSYSGKKRQRAIKEWCLINQFLKQELKK